MVQGTSRHYRTQALNNSGLAPDPDPPQHPFHIAFCHRPLLSVTPAECAACFAADDVAQSAYGIRQECVSANITPSVPSSIPSDDLDQPIADETVERALTLESFEPIERLAHSHPLTRYALTKACGKAGREDWLKQLLAIVEADSEKSAGTVR